VSRLVFKFDPVRLVMRDPLIHAALIPCKLMKTGEMGESCWWLGVS
jgi:hypothetical protein